MPTTLLLVRHGQTEWNRVDLFRGRADIELNETGFRQATATAARLTKAGLAAVYSSPLRRSMSTARPIADAAGLAIIPQDALTDVDYGLWQGLTLEQAAKHNPDLFEEWKATPQTVRFPEGERMEEVRFRAAGLVDSLLKAHAGQTFAVVTHIVVCRLLTLHLLDLGTSHFWNVTIDNCGISTFEQRENYFIALSLNDTCHLASCGCAGA